MLFLSVLSQWKKILFEKVKVILKICFIVLCLFGFPAFGEKEDAETREEQEILQSLKAGSYYGSSLKVIQKRRYPVKFLSEISGGIVPVIHGAIFSRIYSTDLNYRFYFNRQWSAHFKYARFFTFINPEGSDMVKRERRIPLELNHSKNQGWFAGIDWYPFYGKTLFFNQVIHFDLYLSLSGGWLDQLRQSEKAQALSFGGGAVFWCGKRFNTRLELKSLYSRSPLKDSRKNLEDFLLTGGLFVGVVF